MNFIRVMLISTLMLICGCFSIMEHSDGTVYYPYNPTVDETKTCLGVWWHGRQSGEDMMASAIIKSSYLFWVVDFPFEIVSDTVCMPYDLFFHAESESK